MRGWLARAWALPAHVLLTTRRALLADAAAVADGSGAWLLDERALAAVVVLAAAFATLCGCQAPEAVIRGDALAARSEEAYARGVESLVRATADRLREERRAHAKTLFDLAWAASVRPDGTIASEDAVRHYSKLAELYAAADVDWSNVMTVLAKARLNLADAAELRAAIRDYLGAAGVTRETVDAVVGEIGKRIGAGDLLSPPKEDGK